MVAENKDLRVEKGPPGHYSPRRRRPMRSAYSSSRSNLYFFGGCSRRCLSASRHCSSRRWTRAAPSREPASVSMYCRTSACRLVPCREATCRAFSTSLSSTERVRFMYTVYVRTCPVSRGNGVRRPSPWQVGCHFAAALDGGGGDERHSADEPGADPARGVAIGHVHTLTMAPGVHRFERYADFVWVVSPPPGRQGKHPVSSKMLTLLPYV